MKTLVALITAVTLGITCSPAIARAPHVADKTAALYAEQAKIASQRNSPTHTFTLAGRLIRRNAHHVDQLLFERWTDKFGIHQLVRSTIHITTIKNGYKWAVELGDPEKDPGGVTA